MTTPPADSGPDTSAADSVLDPSTDAGQKKMPDDDVIAAVAAAQAVNDAEAAAREAAQEAPAS